MNTPIKCYLKGLQNIGYNFFIRFHYKFSKCNTKTKKARENDEVNLIDFDKTKKISGFYFNFFLY